MHYLGGMELLESPPVALVNDVHSGINPTSVAEVWSPRTVEEAAAMIGIAATTGRSVCVCGARHAMGGQQFLTGGVLLDTRRLTRIVSLDAERGVVRVEAGITWPELVRELHRLQSPHIRWSIGQKQTGADRLTLGGALSANVHGRGLGQAPIVSDVESFLIALPNGSIQRCSRESNPALFGLAIGGYGLFGVILEVDLRLRERRALRRRVVAIDADELAEAFDDRRDQGFTHGDFQFEIDPHSPGFLHHGVFSCYEPIDEPPPPAGTQKVLGRDDWLRLIHLAHTDKSTAFDEYQAHYLRTDGQRYWSDTHQIAEYVEGYHPEIDRLLGTCGGEMITELFVPPARVAALLADAREVLRAHEANVIYGTVRRISPESDTFLRWAREPLCGVVLNLHVDHTADAIERSGAVFRDLIDAALAHRGRFYLTYHRFAEGHQLRAAYPQLPRFLRSKRVHDPARIFDSDWLRAIEDRLASDSAGRFA